MAEQTKFSMNGSVPDQKKSKESSDGTGSGKGVDYDNPSALEVIQSLINTEED